MCGDARPDLEPRPLDLGRDPVRRVLRRRLVEVPDEDEGRAAELAKPAAAAGLARAPGCVLRIPLGQLERLALHPPDERPHLRVDRVRRPRAGRRPRPGG